MRVKTTHQRISKKRKGAAVVVPAPRTLIYDAKRRGFGRDETGQMSQLEAASNVTYQPIWVRLLSCGG